MNRAEILDQARTIITKDRNVTHGEPEDNFQVIADFWNVYRRAIGDRDFNPVDVGMMMDLFKTARQIGNPFHPDNYVDKNGYVAIAGEIAMRGKRNKEFMEEVLKDHLQNVMDSPLRSKGIPITSPESFTTVEE